MVPPLGWAEHSFLTSALSVGHNAVKNILFRISSLLLQFTVLKTLAYIACRLSAYTSFLMLAEDIIQKYYFLWAHGIDRQTWIVVAFIILFPAAGLYDTWLWTLDVPGYIIKSTLVSAQTFSRQLLPNPAYIFTIPGNAREVDVDTPLSANLYAAGANITLIDTPLPLAREVVPPLRNLSEFNQPRLWLDDEGWSVGSDLTWTSFAGEMSCAPTTSPKQRKQLWACRVNNTNAYTLFERSVGEPKIWWDNTDGDDQYDSIVPLPKENVWHSLGPYGASAVMKQIFTVTKGQRRHTLLETVWKVTMTTYPPTQFQDHEVLDLVRRLWNNDPDQVVNPEIKGIVDQVMLAQLQGNSLSIGMLSQQEFAIYASAVEFMTALNPMNISHQIFSAFRIRMSNITLLRSETLPPNTIQPVTPCPVSYANVATGGRIRDTTCARRIMMEAKPTDTPFKGQIDSSTIVILTDILGKGNTNTSESALDPKGVNWLLKNDHRLDGLMASRALILGGNNDVVQLGHQKLLAAISYLQLTLMLIPMVLAVFAFLLVSGNTMNYYKNSFLAAVCATTHVSDNSCRQIGYLKKPPLIKLKKIRRHIVIGTPDGGTLANIAQDQVVAYSMITEPLNLPPPATSKGAKDVDEQEILPMLSPLRKSMTISRT